MLTRFLISYTQYNFLSLITNINSILSETLWIFIVSVVKAPSPRSRFKCEKDWADLIKKFIIFQDIDGTPGIWWKPSEFTWNLGGNTEVNELKFWTLHNNTQLNQDHHQDLRLLGANFEFHGIWGILSTQNWFLKNTFFLSNELSDNFSIRPQRYMFCYVSLNSWRIKLLS